MKLPNLNVQDHRESYQSITLHITYLRFKTHNILHSLLFETSNLKTQNQTIETLYQYAIPVLCHQKHLLLFILIYLTLLYDAVDIFRHHMYSIHFCTFHLSINT